MPHDYQEDPQSGAGNCVCGANRLHRRHPHPFTKAWIWAQRVGAPVCVCGKTEAEHPAVTPESESNR